MSYITVEVDIDHGRVVPREPAKLPEKGTGLLTILPAGDTPAQSGRPHGLAQGQFVVPADFNAPLPEGTLREFEGS